jgi:hypothetical protein
MAHSGGYSTLFPVRIPGVKIHLWRKMPSISETKSDGRGRCARGRRNRAKAVQACGDMKGRYLIGKLDAVNQW